MVVGGWRTTAFAFSESSNHHPPPTTQRTVMGINDRDYVRRDGPGFLGSFVERGTICKRLIGVNVVVFVIQLFNGVHGPNAFTDALELNVDRVFFHGEVWRIITHAFLHDPGDVFHILFNMAFLWWFGSDV